MRANMDNLKMKKAMRDVQNMSNYGYATKTPEFTQTIMGKSNSRLQMENQNIYSHNKISKSGLLLIRDKINS